MIQISPSLLCWDQANQSAFAYFEKLWGRNDFTLATSSRENCLLIVFLLVVLRAQRFLYLPHVDAEEEVERSRT